jgi:putative toxin-antitoxin system antitoxin component (TIGR02293 family)
MTAASVAKWFGGSSATVPTEMELLDAVERGLPVAALDALISAGRLTASEAERMVLPRRTLAYRKSHRQRLSREESDRLARIARLARRAELTFGSAARADVWLRQPNRALGRRQPLDLLGTGEGGLLVESVLVRIDDGVYE